MANSVKNPVTGKWEFSNDPNAAPASGRLRFLNDPNIPNVQTDVIIPGPPPGWGPDPVPGSPDWNDRQRQPGLPGHSGLPGQSGIQGRGPDYIRDAQQQSPFNRAASNPAVTVKVLDVDGVSINLPAGASVNANGTIILKDGSAVNPLDAVRAWRSGQKHL